MIRQSKDMCKCRTFLAEAWLQRKVFSKLVLENYPTDDHPHLRTEIDSLLIMYDQMHDKLAEAEMAGRAVETEAQSAIKETVRLLRNIYRNERVKPTDILHNIDQLRKIQ